MEWMVGVFLIITALIMAVIIYGCIDMAKMDKMANQSRNEMFKRDAHWKMASNLYAVANASGRQSDMRIADKFTMKHIWMMDDAAISAALQQKETE